VSQPTWKTLWSTDDETLRIDETGVYDPELDVSQDDEDSNERYTYTVCLEQLFLVEGRYVTRTIAEGYKAGTLPYPITSYGEWFYRDLGSVASFVGSTKADLLESLCSEDPGTRACVYSAIGSYHGFANFDGYPTVSKLDPDDEGSDEDSQEVTQ
jgi:hypothetical protein